MKKLLFRGPVMTASGYGVHARMLLKALMDSEMFDITVASTPWGATPLIYERSEFLDRVNELSRKFNPQGSWSEFDVSIQVTIPSEFSRLGMVNIGVTAGIEVDKVSPTWLMKSNEFMDLIIVPSEHSKQSYEVVYAGKLGERLKLEKPIVVLPEWINTAVYNTDPVDANTPQLEFPGSSFNFLSVGLGLDKVNGDDRKNFSQLIKWFCEQFKGSQQVGLVLKLSMVNNSQVDFKRIKDHIQFVKASAGCGQFPRIHLIHGRMSERELAALYKNPTVKAYVTLTHGEGYGLPIIEAAACGLPVIATDWSGHRDFLCIDGQKKFVPVDYELKEIPESAVWKDVMEAGTRWACAVEADAKMKMAKFHLSPEKPKEWANELAAHIASKYTDELGKMFVKHVLSVIP